MAEPFAELAELDKLVHEPARLAIMTSLSACQGADFRFLQRLTSLNKGTLSSHLTKLEAAGLVTVTKRFVGKTPNTQLQLTDRGQAAIDHHWQTLERLRSEARRWHQEPHQA
jgi:DNA-binding transcriptional ArsR family regulator